jgi:hypothetical protein
MPRYTCVTTSPTYRVVERDAASAAHAAEACAVAAHSAYWSELCYVGQHQQGEYAEYCIKAGARTVVGTVRVYANYKPVDERCPYGRVHHNGTLCSACTDN